MAALDSGGLTLVQRCSLPTPRGGALCRLSIEGFALRTPHQSSNSRQLPSPLMTGERDRTDYCLCDEMIPTREKKSNVYVNSEKKKTTKK